MLLRYRPRMLAPVRPPEGGSLGASLTLFCGFHLRASLCVVFFLFRRRCMFCPLIGNICFAATPVARRPPSSVSRSGRCRFRLAISICADAFIIYSGIYYFYVHVGAAVVFLRRLSLYLIRCCGALSLLVCLLPLAPAGRRSFRPSPASGLVARSLCPLPSFVGLRIARSSLSSLRRRRGREVALHACFYAPDGAVCVYLDGLALVMLNTI